MQKLTKQEFIEFCKTHQQEYINFISRNYPFTETQLELLSDQLHWGCNGISSNYRIIWTTQLVEKYIHKLGFGYCALSDNAAMPWSNGLIIQYKDLFDLKCLNKNRYIDWSEAMIESIKDVYDWHDMNVHITDELIERYFFYWNWGFGETIEIDNYRIDGLSSSENVCWNIELIRKYNNHIDWNLLSCNKSIPFTIEMLSEFEDKWNWRLLSDNPSLPFSIKLLYTFYEKWDWANLSLNSGFDFTFEIIFEFKLQWNWYLLSCNSNVPFTVEIISAFEDKWIYENLFYNSNAPDIIQAMNHYREIGSIELLESYLCVLPKEEIQYNNYFIQIFKTHFFEEINPWNMPRKSKEIDPDSIFEMHRKSFDLLSVFGDLTKNRKTLLAEYIIEMAFELLRCVKDEKDIERVLLHNEKLSRVSILFQKLMTDYLHSNIGSFLDGSFIRLAKSNTYKIILDKVKSFYNDFCIKYSIENEFIDSGNLREMFAKLWDLFINMQALKQQLEYEKNYSKNVKAIVTCNITELANYVQQISNFLVEIVEMCIVNSDNEIVSLNASIKKEEIKSTMKIVNLQDIKVSQYLVKSWHFGFKYNENEILRFLNGINELSKKSDKHLLGNVILQHQSTESVVIEGLQQIMILYLVERYCNVSSFSIQYEGKPQVNDFLNIELPKEKDWFVYSELNENKRFNNLEIFYIHQAYAKIALWFTSSKIKKEKFAKKFTKQLGMILGELPIETNAEEFFEVIGEKYVKIDFNER